MDPLLALAFSIHSGRGVYALLLGSGVSRSAGIPTGWEIVLDLIREVARLTGENPEPDPAAWYARRHGAPPDYETLLSGLARSGVERSQLLRRYFEPSEEDRERGLKLPGPAHRAIASLVEDGYIRVILTTNFDRLLEKALEERGIVATVIGTPDAIEGALPLPHSGCTLVKLNGDYLDTRAKNLSSELDRYDGRLEGLLDRILDEFGLVVCGWSGKWDIALRSALERSRNHRFTTYWTSRGAPGEPASRLIQLRRAELVPIRNADSFFTELAEKVFALRDIAAVHPLSTKVAVARVKRYLESDAHRIRLHDLVIAECRRLREEISETRFPVLDVPFETEEFRRRVERYEAVCGTLRTILVHGCYWGDGAHRSLWVRCLESVAEVRAGTDEAVVWAKLRSYPALQLLYAGGLAAVAAGKYATLSALLTGARVRDGGRDRPICLKFNSGAVVSGDVGWPLSDSKEETPSPVSEHLFRLLRDSFREFLPDDPAFEECFDRFEYLLGLVILATRRRHSLSASAPLGRFAWRSRPGEWDLAKVLDAEIEALGEEWPPLKEGLFQGETGALLSLKRTFDEFATAART
jgi:hypothetical protein